MPAHVRELGRPDAPGCAGKLDRTHERHWGNGAAGSRAAGREHPAVEGGVVGEQVVRVLDDRRELIPHHPEIRLAGDVLPLYAVDVSEPEMAPGRPDQAVKHRTDA